MRTRAFTWSAILIVAATLIVSACGEGESPSGEARIVIPPYPYWETDAIKVDTGWIQGLASSYCLLNPGNASSQEFFLGNLPLASFDAMFQDPFSRTEVEILTGDFYLSGYFGGLWLRDALNPATTTSLESGDMSGLLHTLFDGIATSALRRMDLVENGSDRNVLRKAGRQIRLQLFIYGYNRGYLEQIIQHPPAGLTPPSDILACSDDIVLDCSAPQKHLPFLDRYDGAVENLRYPPTRKWEKLRRQDEEAWTWVEEGRKVWDVIDISSLGETDYRLLLDLSLNFLLVSKATVLGSMTGWADRNQGEARPSLMGGGGMFTWSMSYFMGLMFSPAPYGTFPQLECPTR